MYKRKFDGDENQKRKYVRTEENIKKHSLDSDEEDEKDDNNVLDEDEIEGEEEGISGQDDGDIPLTAFNMREEMEEGHFDKQGHFIWKNEKEIRDNWLDNINWQQVKNRDTTKNENSSHGLADESDSDQEHFDEIEAYKQLLTYMRPNETVNKTLQRLGGDIHKLSSVERLKRKKAGTLNTNKDVEKVTELANSILTEKGNMDVYQETYQQIAEKIERVTNKTKQTNTTDSELDMYSDDFGAKEKEKLQEAGPSNSTGESSEDTSVKEKILMWEFKWKQDVNEIQGPFNTEQMHKWSTEGYFKTGVWVRKCGENSNFYTSNRIDFDLYL